MAVRYPRLYQLHYSVGRRRTNRENDVKLIQAMMRFLREKTLTWKSKTPEVTVTGRFNSDLAENIKYFQRYHGRGKLVVDGIVSPMRRGPKTWPLATFSNGTLSTLWVLNAFTYAHSKSFHASIHRQTGGIATWTI